MRGGVLLPCAPSIPRPHRQRVASAQRQYQQQGHARKAQRVAYGIPRLRILQGCRTLPVKQSLRGFKHNGSQGRKADEHQHAQRSQQRKPLPQTTRVLPWHGLSLIAVARRRE